MKLYSENNCELRPDIMGGVVVITSHNEVVEGI